MGIHVDDLRDLIIRPTLEILDEYSPALEALLVGTAAQESGLGLHINCCRTTGLGIYRITSARHLDIWDNYLMHYPELASRQRGLASQHQFLKNPHAELITNLSYATGIATMIYRRALTHAEQTQDINNIAQCWAKHFDNGTQQARAAEKFIVTYRKLVMRECKKPRLKITKAA